MLQLILIYIARLWHSESSVLLLAVCDVWAPTPSVADFWNAQCHSSCTAGLWDTEFRLLTFTGKCLALYDIRNLNWNIKCALFLFFIYLKHYDWIASNLKSIQKKRFQHLALTPTCSFLASWEKKWGMTRKMCCFGVSIELQLLRCLELPWHVFVLQQVLIFKHLLKAYCFQWHGVHWPRLVGAVCLHWGDVSNLFHKKAFAVTSTSSLFNSKHPKCRHLNLILICKQWLKDLTSHKRWCSAALKSQLSISKFIVSSRTHWCLQLLEVSLMSF